MRGPRDWTSIRQHFRWIETMEMKMAKKKMIARTMTLEGMISDAFGDLQTLRDEMGDWADSLSNANMDHLPKYDEVEEARSTLDNFVDDEPTFPVVVPTGLVVELNWEEPGAKRRLTRSIRRDDAVELIGRVIEHLEEFLGEHEDEDDAVWKETDRSEWEQLVTDLENAKDEAESVEFPRAFG